MKLFHWDRMKSLERYASGDLIVIAEDVESARFTALTEYQTYLRTDANSRFKFMFDLYGELSEWDEDDRDDFQELVRKFEEDICTQPEEKTAVFISGSE